MRSRKEARLVHNIIAGVIRNVLRQVPDGYLCRLQVGGVFTCVTCVTCVHLPTTELMRVEVAKRQVLSSCDFQDVSCICQAGTMRLPRCQLHLSGRYDATPKTPAAVVKQVRCDSKNTVAGRLLLLQRPLRVEQADCANDWFASALMPPITAAYTICQTVSQTPSSLSAGWWINTLKNIDVPANAL